MPRKRGQSWEDVVADEVLSGWDARNDALAEQLGDAPGTARLSTAEEMDLYWFTDPRFADTAALVAAGRTPEEATAMKHPKRFAFLRFGGRSLKEQIKLAQRLNREGVDAMASGWLPPVGVLDGTEDVQASPEPTPEDALAAPPMPLPGMPVPQPGMPPAPGEMPAPPPPGALGVM